MYSSSVLRCYNISMAGRVIICGVDIVDGTVGIVAGCGCELTGSELYQDVDVS
jgi:hypothetical protein